MEGDCLRDLQQAAKPKSDVVGELHGEDSGIGGYLQYDVTGVEFCILCSIPGNPKPCLTDQAMAITYNKLSIYMQSCLAGLYAEPNDLQSTRSLTSGSSWKPMLVWPEVQFAFTTSGTSVLAPGNFAVDATQKQSQQTSFTVSQPSDFAGSETWANVWRVSDSRTDRFNAASASSISLRVMSLTGQPGLPVSMPQGSRISTT